MRAQPLLRVDNASMLVGLCAPMGECLVLAPLEGESRVFVAPDGTRMVAPADWECLPPGDAMMTRRVKQAGPSWSVIEKRGRKAFSKGLWAPRTTIERVKAEAIAERATDDYAKKRRADLARREREQSTYVQSFESEVFRFLSFSSEWTELARVMARKVAAHATPVGSGTVARTKRIAIDERARAAVIAWMRHQTTAYDRMVIPRVAGERRNVRRELARISTVVLDRHRRNVPHDVPGCALCTAIVSAVRTERAATSPAAPSSSNADVDAL